MKAEIDKITVRCIGPIGISIKGLWLLNCCFEIMLPLT